MLRRVFLPSVFASILAATGCVSVPKRVVQSVASPDGVTQNRLVEAGGIAVLSSSGWLPGASANGLQFAQQVSCATPTTLMHVEWSAALIISKSEAAEVCHLALSAGQFLLGYVSHYDVSIEPTLYLVPKGDGIQRRTFSMHPPETLQAVFVFRWYPDDRRMRSEIVDTVAHELFHLRAAIQDKSKDSYPEELAAYLVGACAQLHVNGAIFLNSVAAGKVPDNVPDGPYRVSMQAARDSYESLHSLFDADGWIRASGKAGQRLATRCQNTLTDWFAE